MKTVALIFQILVALGLLNVWLLRFRKPTPYRGGQARSMPEEFAAFMRKEAVSLARLIRQTGVKPD